MQLLYGHHGEPRASFPELTTTMNLHAWNGVNVQDKMISLGPENSDPKAAEMASLAMNMLGLRRRAEPNSSPEGPSQ